MARPSTMPPPWVSLADAYGGVGKLADEIGITGMHLHRLAHGKTAQVREPVRRAVVRAAEAKGLPNPFTSGVLPVDEAALNLLELFGGSSSMEHAAPETIARLKGMVTDDQLIALTELAEAEPDRVSVSVLRAAAFLLET